MQLVNDTEEQQLHAMYQFSHGHTGSKTLVNCRKKHITYRQSRLAKVAFLDINEPLMMSQSNQGIRPDDIASSVFERCIEKTRVEKPLQPPPGARTITFIPPSEFPNENTRNIATIFDNNPERRCSHQQAETREEPSQPLMQQPRQQDTWSRSDNPMAPKETVHRDRDLMGR
ncbi:hypothetical protein BX666DRAFT_794625 [Dichotomocladium elegans]|nr:hypothetical protein BX666DRAFT_794625 [Dichotomocladium elegans]